MVLAAKAAEKKRQTILAVKVQQKQVLANQALPTWEKSILPNWKAVLRDEKLRDTWWSGTMPPRHRARLWQGCIGNGLALGKASYNRSMVLVQAHLKAGRFTKDMLENIDTDITYVAVRPTCLLIESRAEIVFARKAHASADQAVSGRPSSLRRLARPANGALGVLEGDALVCFGHCAYRGDAPRDHASPRSIPLSGQPRQQKSPEDILCRLTG